MSLIKQIESLDKSALPKHVGIIMDGNGRWAKQKGKPRAFGHKAGVESVRSSVKFCLDAGIPSLTIYAFSSENWNRPAKEVSLLMTLFMTVLRSEVKKLHKNGVKLKIVGNVSGFSPALQKKISEAELKTKDNTKMTLNVAANYGGRWEITQAAKQVAEQVLKRDLAVEDIQEEHLSAGMLMLEQPELDLMVRTSGEHRISNFLLWHAAYAEFYFTDVHWPDFNEDEFAKAILCFASRNRRFGMTGEQVDYQGE